MPLDKYFSGHGSEVMRSMRKTYGDAKGERVFYAAANKAKKRKPAKRSANFRRLHEMAKKG